MRLTLRLKAILAQCCAGEPLWDLCCDHGYLGEAALASGLFSEVIFNDCVEGALTGLRQRVHENPRARVLCQPAELIAEPLTGNIVLAGVGGEKIAAILLAHASRANLPAQRLILCPEKDAAWLAQQSIPGFALSSRERIAHNHGERWIFTFTALRVEKQATSAASGACDIAASSRAHT